MNEKRIHGVITQKENECCVGLVAEKSTQEARKSMKNIVFGTLQSVSSLLTIQQLLRLDQPSLFSHATT